MLNKRKTTRRQGRLGRSRLAASCLAGSVGAVLVLLLLSACSSVFTSSLGGRIIDQEAYDEGNTVGVADASVWLYTSKKDWEADFAAYAEGDESTLPDAPARSKYKYFQSTVTGEDGSYQFNGFVWQTIFPQFGKTADRNEIFLLIYHRDYGLWKNPVPLFIVSDVTTQLDMIRITNLWHDARVSGRVLDWASDSGQGLGGVSVNIYIAENWQYDGNTIIEEKYTTSPNRTVTTDADGYYVSDLRFPMKPSRAANNGNAPIRVAFERENYRSVDPADGSGLSNPGLVTDNDINNNGRLAADGDYGDAFFRVVIEKKSDAKPVNTVEAVTMQRWRFSTTVRGRVREAGGPPYEYLNGVEVTLGIPVITDTSPVRISEAININETTQEDGHFNFGTVSWEMKDLLPANRKNGNVEFEVDPDLTASQTITVLRPGVAVNLILETP